MGALLFWCVVVCALLPCAFADVSCAKRHPNKDGMGVGQYRVDPGQSSGLWGNVCVEEVRCGPKTLRLKNELVECHGVIATCDEWATLQMRTHDNGARYEPSILLRGYDVPAPIRRGDLEIIRATALANFCIAQVSAPKTPEHAHHGHTSE